jgi:type IV pilus assembly protein PilA
MKKLNNKGFSLVELIIVIAIMVILVAVLAPQFTKWVERSRIGTDIQNASEIATAVQVALAEGKVTAPVSTATVPSTTTLTSLTAVPKTKSTTVGKDNDFTYTVSDSGAVTVTANGHTLFPEVPSTDTALYKAVNNLD